MIIQYCSDLHLEFKENERYIKHRPLTPVGDVLILAGDITLFTKLSDHNDFFNYVSDHFKTTYWVPGNHEYYYADINERSGFLKESIRSNLFLVNNCAIEQDGVKFLFSTLWSRISPSNEWRIRNSLSDFHVIKSGKELFSVAEFNELHEESVKFLRTELQDTRNTKTVVVSHHVPTFKNYPPQYKGDALNEAFASELDYLIEDIGPEYWIYGHHHSCIPPFMIGKTELLTNQLGYVQLGEHQSFVKNACFTL